ncbi:FAD dependent oxidoreductase [Lindgomyces ingoldianus]|uniref:FAD dependent oxidoreductase n=1 Tax=Lindgomyces ingoldianus TaxID=673940 RepID=A0ACB6RDU2_9PLEO|nr:FAD dependent oxidoreductase [Lindgomyces ingoldianus]KAF2477513.1 FAD dependent oxidoreductase [Lindgomyces ingoldianus]
MSSVVILGAGVIGLQTAVSLLEAGYNVTIIAKHFPGDESIEYTSPWAGAIWRTHATPDQEEQCRWDLESYKSWIGVLENDRGLAEEMGIQVSLQFILFKELLVLGIPHSPNPSSPSLWFSSHVQNFSVILPTDLPPGCLSGVAYDSIAINPSKYLFFLLSKASRLGLQVIKADLPTSAGLSGAISSTLSLIETKASSPDGSNAFPIVINCTGLGAKSLCPADSSNLYPIRGQTLLVRIHPCPPPNILRIIMHEDPSIAPAVTYIIPRPGTNEFVLGGTKKPNDWSPEPDAETCERIIARCRSIWPDMADVEIEISSMQVGLRPGRKGGVRVGVEEIDVGVREGVMGKVKVVHQYGHAGAGYQNSIGSARKVVDLVRGIVE